MADGAAPVDPVHRDWALVGTRDAPERALVDPRGRVTPVPGGWSLDWWIGADDRWHLPATDAGVRQRLLGAAPVVETAMRIPSGDAVQRVYAVRATDEEGGGDFVVVEVENRSPVPVALALAVRPANPQGPARVERIEPVDVAGGIDPGGGPAGGGRRGLRIDGRLGVVLPREPVRSVALPAAEGDSLDVVVAGEAPDGVAALVDDADGRATAAMLFPLPHTAVLRVLLPLHLPEVRRGRAARRGPAAVVRVPDRVPTGEQVAKGWEAQGDRGLRAQLPGTRVGPVVEAARRWLLLAHAGADIVDGGGVRPAGALAVADLVPVVAALDELGFADEATQVLASWEERAATDGSFAGPQRRLDANGAALWAAARHWELHRDEALAELLVGPLAKAAQWIVKRRRSRHADRETRPPSGCSPTAGRRPSPVAPTTPTPATATTSGRCSRLRRAWPCSPRPASPTWRHRHGRRRRRAGRRARRAAWWPMAAGRAGFDPLGPGRPPGLRASSPGSTPWRRAPSTRTIRRRPAPSTCWRRPASVPVPVPDPRGVPAGGVRPALTAWLARVELAAGRVASAAARLQWLVDHATPVVTWPEVWSPSSRAGADGAGFDVVALAGVCSLVRDLLVREVPGSAGVEGLALLSWVPGDWYGQAIEVHDAPTSRGLLSYAVRWHGPRPALLWELVPHDDGRPVRLTVPGLDPTWSTDRPSGEALLAAPDAPPPGAAQGPAPSPTEDPSPGVSFS
ncbi:MAG: hypothetical protein R2726_07190 [Acidimicrobiales bacterium]